MGKKSTAEKASTELNQQPEEQAVTEVPEAVEITPETEAEVTDQPEIVSEGEEFPTPEPEPTPEEPASEESVEPVIEPEPMVDQLAKAKIKKPLKQKLTVAAAVVTGVLLIAGIGLNRYYNNRVLPKVTVAGINSSNKTVPDLKSELEAKHADLAVTIETGNKELKPKLKEIGFELNVEKTLENAVNAKRGFFDTLMFWKSAEVPAVVTVNETLLDQYVEKNTRNLSKAAVDARLTFDTTQDKFVISKPSDGSGPDTDKLRAELIEAGNSMTSSTITVGIIKKAPKVTPEKLEELVEPANELISHSVVLTGEGRSFQASRAEIASWITPTPKDDGSVKLVIDPAKIQSYVESVGKQISRAVQDKKVIKDTKNKKEIVLQQGVDGTELTGKQQLATAIASALDQNEDISQTMTIQKAAYKTVNMTGYDKWIEVDLSDQRLTAYEKATAVNTFLISSGLAQTPTVKGEFAIWHKNRSQTMTGGSRATGDYYNLPNVEWVSYFYQDYAIHGAYWHNNFGRPMSHGCVNASNANSKWIFEWAPMGTKVIVHD